jgi:t-SNARE complex subunit (syntaxin)
MDRLSSNVEAEDNSLRFVLMEERREEAEQVARDTVLLAESFQDVAQMVKEQGVMLDQMEAATEATLNNTSGGKEHLRQASESKRFWVGAISAVAGTLILTAFGLAALGRMTRKELDK